MLPENFSENNNENNENNNNNNNGGNDESSNENKAAAVTGGKKKETAASGGSAQNAKNHEKRESKAVPVNGDEKNGGVKKDENAEIGKNGESENKEDDGNPLEKLIKSDVFQKLSNKLNEIKNNITKALNDEGTAGDSILPEQSPADSADSENNPDKYTIPEVLPLLPTRDLIVFPYMIVPFFIGRKKSLRSIETAIKAGRKIFLASQKDPKNEKPDVGDICEFGIVAEILQMMKLPDGTAKILVEGLRRVRIVDFLDKSPDSFMVKVEEVVEKFEDSNDFQALKRLVLQKFESYLKLNRKIPLEIMMVVLNTEDPSRLADIITSHLMNLKTKVKQEILEEFDVNKRFRKILQILNNEVEILGLEKKIRNRTHEQIENTQREYFLREQLRSIQKELGEDENTQKEADDFNKKLKALKLSKENEEKIAKEISRFAKMHSMSPESSVLRTYIEWVLELPWHAETKDNLDIKSCEKILEEDHYGLDKIKERILEFLSVRKLAQNKLKAPILCFVGPPGVGKTSLGKSIARALDRKFARMSLGGMRDEAEIRGHRRTYVGSMPGKIMQLMHQVKAKNPVILLDEIDKLANDFRGDPASALLEVLDPEQNDTFNDLYLNLPYDLSKVLFITTANIPHNIPAPLFDRMEVIRLSGYTEDEKLNIAQKYLVPKQIEQNGLTVNDISFSRDALIHVIRYFTREAGVRNLEREIGSVIRKCAKEVAMDINLNETATKTPKLKPAKLKNGKGLNKSGMKNVPRFSITPAKVEELLGAKRFKYGHTEIKDRIGAVNGLAWSEAGGSVLVIESALMNGRGNLNLTGQLGNVMQESAKAAFSYIRSHSKELGVSDKLIKTSEFHVHVPEGATPKDGPSAGIALCSSLVSLMTKTHARGDVAMTGEITLSGRVLPIGGVKEKVLAAHGDGILTIILPEDNRKDIEDIPENIRKQLEFHFVSDVSEVFKVVFKKPLIKKGAGKSAENKTARAAALKKNGAKLKARNKK